MVPCSLLREPYPPSSRSASRFAAVLLFLLIQAYAVCGQEAGEDRPRLVIQPEGARISQPSNSPFGVTCKGIGESPALFSDLKWFDPNGEELTTNNYRNPDIQVTATSEEGLLLTFLKPSTNDGGTYKCRANFQKTDSLEAQVDIIFYQDISWEDCPTVQALVKGSSNGLVRCGASANPPPAVTWSKDGKGIDGKSERYITQNNGIKINDKVVEEDAGRYVVRALVAETGRLSYQIITVEVQVIPKIVELNQQTEVTDAEEVTIGCKAQGTPSPVYSWLDPQKRNLSTVGGYRVDRDAGLLTINKVNRENDNGFFTCIAENSAGKEENRTRIVIITKPTVTSFENITAVKDYETMFECRATGDPPPKMTIRRDGTLEPLRQGEGGVLVEEKVDNLESVLRLTMKRVDRKDDGLYYCSAENKGGKVDRVGHLQVEFPPDLSSNTVTVKTWEMKPVNMSCIAEAIPNATIIWHFRGILIEYNHPSYAINTVNGVSNLLVRPAGSQGSGGGDVFGSYRCEAVNNHGRSQLNIQLEQAFRPGPVAQPNFDRSTPTTIVFSIQPPANDGGLPVKKFWVFYRRNGQPLDQVSKHSWPATGTGPYILENLEPRAKYMLRFAAENDVGIGDSSIEYPFIMPTEGPPEQPPLLLQDTDLLSGKILSPNSRDYLCHWSEPLDNGRQIDEYQFKYYQVKRDEASRTGWTKTGQVYTVDLREKELFFAYRILELEPEQFYFVELRAHNTIGYSEPTEFVVRTALGNLDGPSAHFITEASSLALIIGLIILVLVVILIIMDLIFYYKYKAGALYFLKTSCCQTSRSIASGPKGKGCDAAKVGSYGISQSQSDVAGYTEKTEVDNPAFDSHSHVVTEEITPMMANGSNGSGKGDATGLKSSPSVAPKDSAV